MSRAKSRGTPRPKSKVSLRADRLPPEAVKFIHEQLAAFVPDTEIARQMNRRWPAAVRQLYRTGMEHHHIGRFRRHRFETLRGRFHQAGELAATLAKSMGLNPEQKDRLRHEVLHRFFFDGIEKVSQADIMVVAHELRQLEGLRLRERQLDQQAERIQLERQKREEQCRKGQQLATDMERAAEKGEPMDLQKLAQLLREEVYGA